MRTPAPILAAAACLRVGGLFEKDESLVLGGALPLGKRADGAALAHYLLGKDKITESSAALEIRGECGCWLLHLKINNVLTSERRRKQSYSVGLTLRGWAARAAAAIKASPTTFANFRRAVRKKACFWGNFFRGKIIFGGKIAGIWYNSVFYRKEGGYVQRRT